MKVFKISHACSLPTGSDYKVFQYDEGERKQDTGSRNGVEVREGVHQHFARCEESGRNKALYICHEVLLTWQVTPRPVKVFLGCFKSLWMILISQPTPCHPFTLRNVCWADTSQRAALPRPASVLPDKVLLEHMTDSCLVQLEQMTSLTHGISSTTPLPAPFRVHPCVSVSLAGLRARVELSVHVRRLR